MLGCAQIENAAVMLKYGNTIHYSHWTIIWRTWISGSDPPLYLSDGKYNANLFVKCSVIWWLKEEANIKIKPGTASKYDRSKGTGKWCKIEMVVKKKVWNKGDSERSLKMSLMTWKFPSCFNASVVNIEQGRDYCGAWGQCRALQAHVPLPRVP